MRKWPHANHREAGLPFATRSDVMAQNGIAATSHPLATQIAIDILKKNGTAVDAAVAANAALGLMEPHSCGPGGDLFALVYSAKEKKLYGLNASGRSPRALTLEAFRKLGLQYIPAHGPLPVSVPGCVDGWYALHQKFGDLPMPDLLAPTIAYARNGFPVTPIIAHEWRMSAAPFASDANFRKTYLPNGRAPKPGEIFRNPDLAATLQAIANGGRDAFYHGKLAEKIVKYAQRVGCYLRRDDLAHHRSSWVEPISVDYRGYRIWELPPNGQGMVALQMLRLLETYDLSGMGYNSADYLHFLIEAKKLAFEDRAVHYGDPEHQALPIVQLLSSEYAAARRELIDPQRAGGEFRAGDPRFTKGDTVYLSVADREGNMVSLIQSIFRGFGSGLVPDQLGFALQNRGELFCLQPGHVNSFAPGKRPFHTIIPAFVTKDDQPFLSFGVMGGDMQPQGHVQVLCNMIDFGMSPQQAGDAPRFRHDGSSTPTGERMTDGGTVFVEPGIAAETRKALIRRGHRLRIGGEGFGGYQAIRFDAKNRVYHGASESRKDGMAAGF